MRETAAHIVHSAVGMDSVSPVMIEGMQLSSLPPMPPWTRLVSAQNNRITSLPPSLPPALQQLDVSNNRIHRVPHSLLEQPNRAIVVLRNNPLVEGGQLEVLHAQAAPDYRGPRFFFSAPARPADAPAVMERPGR